MKAYGIPRKSVCKFCDEDRCVSHKYQKRGGKKSTRPAKKIARREGKCIEM